MNFMYVETFWLITCIESAHSRIWRAPNAFCLLPPVEKGTQPKNAKAKCVIMGFSTAASTPSHNLRWAIESRMTSMYLSLCHLFCSV